MLIKIYPENPNPKQIEKVVDVLQAGGVIVYPTDSVYGFGCDITKPKAIDRIAKLKGIKTEKANFSFICADLSHLSDYCRQVSTPSYKLLKKALPGPFTFILNANSNVPKLFQSKKKTVGIRVPDNNIAREIVRALGNPILSTSVYDDDEVVEYLTDPELIYERYQNVVDLVIDGGYGNIEASTVVDLTDENEVNIIRQGIGIIEGY